MYGKLINGEIVPAPNPLPQDGRRIYNPPDSAYQAAGYLPIVDTPMPDDAEDTFYTYHREVVDGQIVRVWSPADPPAPPDPAPPTLDQRVDALETAVDNLIIAALEVSADV